MQPDIKLWSLTHYPFVQLALFERGRIVPLRETGWSLRGITLYGGRDGSLILRCWQHCSCEHPYIASKTDASPRSTSWKGSSDRPRGARSKNWNKFSPSPGISKRVVASSQNSMYTKSPSRVAKFPANGLNFSLVFTGKRRFCLHISHDRLCYTETLVDCIHPRYL